MYMYTCFHFAEKLLFLRPDQSRDSVSEFSYLACVALVKCDNVVRVLLIFIHLLSDEFSRCGRDGFRRKSGCRATLPCRLEVSVLDILW